MTTCTACGSDLEPEARYCDQCGQRLGAGRLPGGARTEKCLRLVDVHYNLGLVYFKKERYREAVSAWRRALELEPGNEDIRAQITGAEQRLAETEP